MKVNAFVNVGAYAVIRVNIPTCVHLQNFEPYPHEKSDKKRHFSSSGLQSSGGG
jgi:hypothetical protein